MESNKRFGNSNRIQIDAFNKWIFKRLENLDKKVEASSSTIILNACERIPKVAEFSLETIWLRKAGRWIRKEKPRLSRTKSRYINHFNQASLISNWFWALWTNKLPSRFKPRWIYTVCKLHTSQGRGSSVCDSLIENLIMRKCPESEQRLLLESAEFVDFWRNALSMGRHTFACQFRNSKILNNNFIKS